MKQKNLAVSALAAVFVLVLWWMMIYSPMQSKASTASAAATAAEVKANTLRTQLAQADGATQDRKNAAQASLVDLQAAIPPSPALSKFLRDADAIQKASQVTWMSLTPTAPTSSTGLTTINISIAVQGQYAKVIDYMNRMLAMKRVFVIDNVAMTASSAPGGSAGSAASPLGGAPTGEVFAGNGAAPVLQVQIAGRLFTEPLATASTSAKVGSRSTTPTTVKG